MNSYFICPDFKIKSTLMGSYLDMNVSHVKQPKCSLQRASVLCKLLQAGGTQPVLSGRYLHPYLQTNLMGRRELHRGGGGCTGTRGESCCWYKLSPAQELHAALICSVPTQQACGHTNPPRLPVLYI